MVTLSDGCTLTENVATTKGGGIRIGAGEGYVSSTEFVDNDAPDSPDAHKNSAGTLECTGCPGGEIDVDGCETVDFCQSCVCVPAPRSHRLKHPFQRQLRCPQSCRSGADAGADAHALFCAVSRA